MSTQQIHDKENHCSRARVKGQTASKLATSSLPIGGSTLCQLTNLPVLKSKSSIPRPSASKAQGTAQKQTAATVSESDQSAPIKSHDKVWQNSNSELEAVKQELSSYKEQCVSMEPRQCQEREKCYSVEVTALSALLTKTATEAAVQKEEYESQLSTLRGQLVSCEKTVEELRREKDGLMAERQQLMSGLSEQNALVQSLQNNLSTNIQIEAQKQQLQKQLQMLHSSSKESEDFLQLEQTALQEEIKELQTNLDATKLELSRCVAERDSAQRNAEQLGSQLKQTQSELDQTKVQAHYMLLEQGSEITTSIVALAKLSTCLSGLHSNLEKRVTSLPAVENDSSHSSSASDVGQSGAEPDNRSAGQQLHATSNLEASSQSTTTSTSHDQSMASQESRNSSASESGDSKGDITKDEALPASTKSAFSRPASQSEGTAEAELKETPLFEQIEGAYDILADILVNMREIDHRMTGQCTLMEQQIDSLKTALRSEKMCKKREAERHEGEMQELRAEMNQQSQQQKQLHHSLHTAQEQLELKTADLVFVREQLQEKTQALAEVVDDRQQLKKWGKEVDRLTKVVIDKEAEKKSLQESLDLALGRLDCVDRAAGPQTVTVAELLRRNTLLQTEMRRVKTRAIEKQEEACLKTDKLTRHNQILRENCEKADKELIRLDALVERIAKVLRDHLEDVKTWPEARQIQLELGLTV